MNALTLLKEDRLQKIAGYARVVMSEIVERFQPMSSDGTKARTGGYLVVADSQTGLPLLVMPVGKITDPDDAAMFLELALEKARRPVQHPEHLTSWESRDETRKHFGGSIRLHSEPLILSFSGLPEKLDTAFVLYLSVLATDDTVDQAHETAARIGLIEFGWLVEPTSALD